MIPQRWIEAYLRFLLRRRLAVTLVVAAVTIFFGYSLTSLKLRANFFDFYPRQHEYIRFYNEFRRMFGSPNIMSVILEVTDGDIYTPETLQKLDRLTKYMVHTRGVVPYQISDAKDELKTADIARNARAFTFLISCKAKAKEKETARN